MVIKKVTILILIDGFLQYKMKKQKIATIQVTILILIDGFLQYVSDINLGQMGCHNPYFNRWFSAIYDN